MRGDESGVERETERDKAEGIERGREKTVDRSTREASLRVRDYAVILHRCRNSFIRTHTLGKRTDDRSVACPVRPSDAIDRSLETTRTIDPRASADNLSARTRARARERTLVHPRPFSLVKILLVLYIDMPKGGAHKPSKVSFRRARTYLPVFLMALVPSS